MQNHNTKDSQDNQAIVIKLPELQKRYLPQDQSLRVALIRFGLSVFQYRPEVEPEGLQAMIKQGGSRKSLSQRLNLPKELVKDAEQVASEIGLERALPVIKAAIHYGLADRYSPGMSQEYRELLDAALITNRSPIQSIQEDLSVEATTKKASLSVETGLVYD